MESLEQQKTHFARHKTDECVTVSVMDQAKAYRMWNPGPGLGEMEAQCQFCGR